MPFFSRVARIGRRAVMVALALAVSACDKPQAAPQMPPPAVSVVHPIEREVTQYLYYSGTTRGQKEIQVRGRVSGYLQKVHFQPDRYVEPGEVLFTIDPLPYKIAYDRASSELAGRRAEVTRTWAELERVKSLISQNAASEQELVNRQAEYDLATANVGVAEAELADAKRNLEYTEVKAEIGGRISRNLVDEGALLKADETVLCTIVDDDIVHVYFNVSEREFLEYLKTHPNARKTRSNEEVEPTIIDVGLQNEVGFPHRGRVDSASNTIDVGTATLELRGALQNEDKYLSSGLTVRVRATMGQAKSLLVPDVAVQADPRGPFVYVINDKNIVERRAVQPGQQVGPYRRVLDGLSTTDRVITNGLMMIRVEAPVTPTLVEPPPLPEEDRPATQNSTTQPATTGSATRPAN